MRELLEHWARVATTLFLGATSVVMLLVAYQERSTADFLADLGRAPGFARDTRSAAYYAAFWSDVVIALVLVGAGVIIARVASRTWFGLAVLLCAYSLASGLFALLSVRPEVRTALPMPVVAGALVGVSGLGLLGSLTWLAFSPAPPPRKPANPPVPPSHQAG